MIEYTLSWTENGVPHAGHHLHVLTVRDDRIAVRHGLLRRPLAYRCCSPRWRRPVPDRSLELRRDATATWPC